MMCLHRFLSITSSAFLRQRQECQIAGNRAIGTESDVFWAGEKGAPSLPDSVFTIGIPWRRFACLVTRGVPTEACRLCEPAERHTDSAVVNRSVGQFRASLESCVTRVLGLLLLGLKMVLEGPRIQPSVGVPELELDS